MKLNEIVQDLKLPQIIRRKIWGAGDYCNYLVDKQSFEIFFSHCPYPIEGMLSYEDLVAEDWEECPMEGSAMEYLNEYYPGETILRMELRK